MNFSIKIITENRSSGYNVVGFDTELIGTEGVDMCREKLSMPKLSLELIRGHVSAQWETCVNITLSVITKRFSCQNISLIDFMKNML